MNLYSLILGFTALGGVGITIWGWLVLQKSRKTRQWPTTTGKIEISDPCSVQNDLLPEIIFNYQVNNKDYRRQLQFPEGTHPLPEFTKAYNEKYPVNSTVTVYYDPEHPETATLEPGAQGDWMILAVGIAMFIGGLLSLILA